MIVVIGCGDKKQTVAAKAIDLYIGSYFKSVRAWALSVAHERNIYILSAKWGLIPATKIITPYNLKITDNGSVEPAFVKAQARVYRIDKEQPIVVAGMPYQKFALRVWNTIETPFTAVPNGVLPKGKTGMGYQKHYLKKYEGTVPRRAL